jgi:hypothetical protein
MVNIGNDVAAHIASAANKGVPKGASILLKNDLPPNLQGKIIQGKVEAQNADGSYKIALKSGQTIEAQITPPPKVGSQISFVQLKNGETQLTQMVVDSLKKESAQQNQNGQKGLENQNKQPNSNLSKDSQNNPLLKNSQTINKTHVEAKQQIQITNQNLNQTATNVSPVHTKDPFAQLRPLIGQTVPVQSHDGKPLPQTQNILTVVVSKTENGMQTLRPEQLNSTLPTFKAAFPSEVPEETLLKLNITGSKAQILDLTPPKVQAQNTNQTLPTQGQEKLQIPNLSSEKINRIILTSQVNTPTKALPQGITLDVQSFGKSESLPPITQNITNSQGQKTEQSVSQFRTIFITSGGQKLQITSQTDIPPNTPVRLQNTPQGLQVKQVLQQPIELIQTAAQVLPKNTPVNTPISSQVLAMVNPKVATVSLPQGETLNIQVPTTLQTGMKIQITIADDGIPELIPQSLPQSTIKTIALTELSGEWQTLKQSIDILQKGQIETAQSLKESIPNLSKETLLPNLLSFIDAVNNQTMQRLSTDETLNLLKAMGIDFSADLFSLQQTNAKNQDAPENWRALLFPYVENDQDDPKQGGLFWHQAEDEDGHVHGLRFMTHLNLSTLGETRLDGLVQKSDLQLKLSTENALNETEIKNLKSIVEQTLESFGMTGQITTYQTEKKLEKPIHLVLESLNKQLQNI